jgi:hypothetical protein
MSQPVSIKTQEMPPSWAPAVEIVAGGTGGAVGIAAAAPFMYLKMYMQEKAKDPQNPPRFQKNPLKWFSGAPGLAGWMFPQAAFAFTMNEWMRKKLSRNGEKTLSPWEKLFCSATTGAMTTVFVAPQELIWTQQKKAEALRLKMIEEQKLDPLKVPSKSATQIAQEVWKAHGWKGFYRAGGETALREIVSTSVLTYLAKEYPLLAPVLGATLSQPLDGRKTNKQADFSYKAPLKELFRAKAFSGLLVGRIPIYLVFMNVAPYVKDQVGAI